MASLFGDSPKKKIFIGDKIISTAGSKHRDRRKYQKEEAKYYDTEGDEIISSNALSRDMDREKYKKEEAEYYDTEIKAKEYTPGVIRKLMQEITGEILKIAPDKGKCGTKTCATGKRG